MGGQQKPFNLYSKAASTQDSVVWKLEDGKAAPAIALITVSITIMHLGQCWLLASESRE